MNGIVNLPPNNTFLDFSNKLNTLQDSGATSDMQREKSVVAFLSKGDENNEDDDSSVLEVFFNRHYQKSFDDDRLQVANLSPPIQNYLALPPEKRSLIAAPPLTAAPSTVSSSSSCPSSSLKQQVRCSPPSTASVLATLSTSLSSTVKVFNPEAFCELCQKEFCNKYYLQTHRATKHGILPTSLGATSSSVVVGPSATSTAPLVAVATTSNINNNNNINSSSNCSTSTSNSINCNSSRAAISLQQAPNSSEFNQAAGNTAAPCAVADDEPMMQNLASSFPQSFLSQLQQPANQQQMELQQFMLAASMNESNLQNLYINQLAAMAGGMQGNNDGSTMVSPSPATPATSLPLPVTSSASAESPALDRSQLNPSAAQGDNEADISHILAQLMANPMALQNAQSIPSSTGTPSLLEQMHLMQAAQNMLNQSGNNMSAQMVSNGNGNQTPSALLTPTKEKDKDTYCDLCNKNFCTKSFLKKHRQQQHPETFASPAKPRSFAQQSNPAANDYHSILAKLPSVIVNNSQAPSAVEKNPSPDCAPTLEMEIEPTEPMIKQMRLGESGMKTKPNAIECDVCTKKCDDVIALLNHKTHEHPETLANLNASNKELFNFGDLASSQIKAEISDEKVTCDICDKEFKSQPFLDMHKKQQHTTSALKPQNQTPQQQPHNMNLLNMLPQGFSPFLLPGIGQLQLGELDQATAAALASSLQNSGTPSQVPPTTPKAAKRQYQSSGKNYCDLCNKEVCNKYFLRTHMLKMHGIVIDENKTVIANIDTLEREKNGSLSFRCDQCLTELKSRSLLKAHKQEVHGIPPQPSQGLVSQQRTPKHSTSTTPAQLSLVQHLQEQNPMKSDALGGEKLSCPFCNVPRTYADVWEHMFASHRPEMANGANQEALEFLRKSSIASTVESSASSNDADQFQPQTSMSSDELGGQSDGEELKCNLCNYKTRFNANLQMHLQNHDSMKVSPGEIASQSSSIPFGSYPEDEDDAMRTTTEVALKMARENEEQQLIISSRINCTLCKRNFSGTDALQSHMARCHSAKRVISKRNPQKSVLRKSKFCMKKSFVCTKCYRRFTTRQECFAHAIVHTRQLSQSKSVIGETNLRFETNDLESFIREESSEMHAGQFADHLPRPHSNGQKEERNSHTSGSTSPLSMQTMPEGYAQPVSVNEKPFSMQSFVMREKQANQSSGPKGLFFNELVAHLPVRSLISDPVSITFELQPAPQIDSQVFHI